MLSNIRNVLSVFYHRVERFNKVKKLIPHLECN